MSTGTKDGTFWIKVSVDFFDHPKIICLSPVARDALLEMIAYSHNYQLDGVIPQHVVSRRWDIPLADLLAESYSKRYTERLSNCLADAREVTAIDELMNNDPENPSISRNADGDYVIYDYGKYQETRASIKARKERYRRAGRKGGLANAKQKPEQDSSEQQANAKQTLKRNSSKRLSDGEANAKQTLQQCNKRLPSKPVADIDIDTDIDIEDIPNGISNARASARKGNPTKLDTYFERFWDIYPIKRARPLALKEFKRATKRAPVEAIISGAARFRDDPNRVDEFTPHPQNWLKADGWNDPPLKPRGQMSVIQSEIHAAATRDAQQAMPQIEPGGGAPW